MKENGLLIDTCVVRELSHPAGNPMVKNSIRKLATEKLFLSVMTLGEIEKGIELLPNGRKRDGLAQWLNQIVDHSGEQILLITTDIALLWG